LTPLRFIFGGAFLAAAACGGSGPAPVESAVPDQATPQPAIEAWLAEGHFRGWACEERVSDPRLTGNHGRHRICSNELIVGSAEGPYPAGAASVKELFDPDDQPNGFAVGLKISDGQGPQTWYWYERRGQDPAQAPLAQGVGIPDCAVCHQTASRDNVFFRGQ
jgi:hypothetical protein